MSALSPTLAAELAESAYKIMEPDSDGMYEFVRSAELDRHFSFNLSNGPIKGSSGGFFGLYRRTSGFALLAQGKERFNGHHVIALRGTAGLHDGLTDLNVGLSTGPNDSSIHAGFNKTFDSMKPLLEKQLTPRLRRAGSGHVHCIGHSLGGALASITAGWVKAKYGRPVNLYTFGCPRVGLEGYATKSTFSVDQHYRCTHGADPVPKVPVWPFIHAPNSGAGEYRLDSAMGMSLGAHSMGRTGNPGYRNTAKGDDWTAIRQSSTDFLNRPIRLSYDRRHQASFSGYWADMLNAALITLLKDAGYYSFMAAQATTSSTLTFYDLMARKLAEVAKTSSHYADQLKGLLGHMLVFAGHVGVKVVELSARFIRWVFDHTLGALYRAVRQALTATE